jgi:DNA transposition AAA+ family ATPase
MSDIAVQEKPVHEKTGGLDPATNPERVPATDLDSWRAATERLNAHAKAAGLSRSEIARRSEVPMGTLSPWLDGKYGGSIANVTAKVIRYLDAVEERQRTALAIPDVPDFVMTRAAREVTDALIYAQTMSEMVIITLAAGMGKSTACREFVRTSPGAFMVTMRETTRSAYSMVAEIALELDIPEQNPRKIDRAIGQRLRRNGRQTLLIVDEAQHIEDAAVNQLRYWLDQWGCGIALVGNEEVHTRWGGASPRAGFGQLHSRIGKRLSRSAPYPEDIAHLLDIWNISDKDCRRLLSTIAKKAGAFRQVDKTIRLAHLLAAGAQQPLSADHIRAAWANRGNEELR